MSQKLAAASAAQLSNIYGSVAGIQQSSIHVECAVVLVNTPGHVRMRLLPRIHYSDTVVQREPLCTIYDAYIVRSRALALVFSLVELVLVGTSAVCDLV